MFPYPMNNQLSMHNSPMQPTYNQPIQSMNQGFHMHQPIQSMNQGFHMHPLPMITQRPPPPTIYAHAPAHPPPTLLPISHSNSNSHSNSHSNSNSHDAVQLARMQGVEDGKKAAKEKKWKKAYDEQKAAKRQGQNFDPLYDSHHDYEQHHTPNHQQANAPTLIASATASTGTSTETEKGKNKHKGIFICKKTSLVTLKNKWKRGLIYLLIFICMVAHMAILRQSLDKINLSQNQEDIKNKIIGVFIVAIIICIAMLGVFYYCIRYITLSFLILTLGLLATAITNIIFLIQLEYN